MIIFVIPAFFIEKRKGILFLHTKASLSAPNGASGKTRGDNVNSVEKQLDFWAERSGFEKGHWPTKEAFYGDNPHCCQINTPYLLKKEYLSEGPQSGFNPTFLSYVLEGRRGDIVGIEGAQGHHKVQLNIDNCANVIRAEHLSADFGIASLFLLLLSPLLGVAFVFLWKLFSLLRKL